MMKQLLKIATFLLPVTNSFAQDTTYLSDKPSTYYVFYKDSMESRNRTTVSCLKREEYHNDTLVTKGTVALDKHTLIDDYFGYYPNGQCSFLREYYYNGAISYLHGNRLVYYPNGQLKEIGHYHLGIRFGEWNYYDSLGNRIRRIQYDVPDIDTINKIDSTPDIDRYRAWDTLPVEPKRALPDIETCISFGKNGIEVLYKKNNPIEVRSFEFGNLIIVEKRKKQMKHMIKNAAILPDIILR